MKHWSLRHHDFHIGAGATPFIEIVDRQDHPHGVRVKDRSRRARRRRRPRSAVFGICLAAGGDGRRCDRARSGHTLRVRESGSWPPISADASRDCLCEKVRGIKGAHPQLPVDWSLHWLRHTHATALLLAGVPEHVVMRRLGHADVQTTLSTYGWVTQDAEMRSLAHWKNYVAGWKGLADGRP